MLPKLSALAAAIALTLSVSCSHQNPDQLREQTAHATETMKQDTKAIAEGVKEGLSSKKTVDLNKASKDNLMTLPGITPEGAERIIAERPYESAQQLVKRHVLSEDEYLRIQDRVIVTR
jgi:DNA uptake protein ComE-like DNA-binding protein